MAKKKKKKKPKPYAGYGPNNTTLNGSSGLINNSVIDGFVGSH